MRTSHFVDAARDSGFRVCWNRSPGQRTFEAKSLAHYAELFIGEVIAQEDAISRHTRKAITIPLPRCNHFSDSKCHKTVVQEGFLR